MTAKNWFKLMCKREELQLLGTLNGGQSFRWKILKEDSGEKWVGVFAKRVWILAQDSDHILYQVHGLAAESSEEVCNGLLRDYFQLDLNLKKHMIEWSEKDAIFKKAASQFYGIRVLNQEVVENIFSFICSSNNNISRITSMVEKLATFFGEKICEIDGQAYYSFPEVDTLAGDKVEDILKKQGFGYRAKYISQSAKLIVSEGGEKWLDYVKSLPYVEAKNKLMTLTGIGPKVADCVCLMSLGHLGSIPIDTHVYQIARNFYMPKLPKQKTVTSKTYKEVGDHFRELYGPLAGWAQTVLFCADLKKFQEQEK